MKTEEEIEEIFMSMRCSTFHHSDEEAKPVIDEYLAEYPFLLELNSADWYYKHF